MLDAYRAERRVRVQVTAIADVLDGDRVHDGPRTVAGGDARCVRSTSRCTRRMPLSSVSDPAITDGIGNRRGTLPFVERERRHGIAGHRREPRHDAPHLDEIVVGVVPRRLGAPIHTPTREHLHRRPSPLARRGAPTCLTRSGGVDPGPTATSARNVSISTSAIPPRGRAARLRTSTSDRHSDFRLRAAAASWPTRSNIASCRMPAACVIASSRRASIARATSSTEHPHNVSCGCESSVVRHAAALEVASRTTSGARGERRPGLGVANQRPLELRVAALLTRARAERPLQRPRVAVRVAQLTADDRQRKRGAARDELSRELAERRAHDPRRCCGNCERALESLRPRHPGARDDRRRSARTGVRCASVGRARHALLASAPSALAGSSGQVRRRTRTRRAAGERA